MNTLQEFPFHVSSLFGFCRNAICVNLLKSSRQAGSCATIFFLSNFKLFSSSSRNKFFTYKITGI